MRAIVTGAYGFVGRHLVRELVSAGYEILATDMFVTAASESAADGVDASGRGRSGDSNAGAVPRFPEGVVYRSCDILNDEGIGELLNDWKPNLVFHLAAQSSASRSFRDPRGTLRTNLFGTLNVLEAARSMKGVGKGARVLSVCSSEEYGRRSPDEMPLVEESPLDPVSPYAVSKAAQSLLSLQYGRSYGLDVVVTRSFSHTGPGQTTVFVLPSFAKQCAEIMHGISDPVIKVGNLDVVRDFLDVRDVVRAYRLLAEGGRGGEVYNVCSGKGLELRYALDVMIKRVPREIEIETDPKLLRPVDLPVMIGNNEKLRRDTGWEAEIPTEKMLLDLVVYWERRIIGSVD